MFETFMLLSETLEMVNYIELMDLLYFMNYVLLFCILPINIFFYFHFLVFLMERQQTVITLAI